MMISQPPQVRQIETTEVFRKNFESTSSVTVNVGGARSSKSFSVIQLFLMKFINEDNKVFLITRKTLPSLRMTAYKVFVDLLTDYGYYNECEHNKSNLTLKYKNNIIYFLSIDSSEKIKSTEFNYVFMEEANEFTLLDYRILSMRMSGPTTPDQPNKMYLSLNPSDEFSWINQKLVHQADVEVIQSTFQDNPFLSDEYIKILEDLKNVDPTLYKIYALGLWAQIENMIYSNYVIDEVFPKSFDDEMYGLDFGFNHPTALMWIGFKDDELYIREIIYESKLTNQDLIDKMITIGITKKTPEYADSAEPDRIEEIYRAGFNVHPAKKGPSSVVNGIDMMKRYKIHLHKDDVNIQKEIRSYKWKEDKNGNILDEPVKFNDDALDGCRYAIFTHNNKTPLISAVPVSRGRVSMGRVYG